MAGTRMAVSSKPTLMALLLLASLCAAYATRPLELTASIEERMEAAKKPHFKTPKGLFIQERASKQLPGPGQHFSFGALKSWEEIHTLLDNTPGAKLLLFVRHGQAVSNWLGDTLGPDIWFTIEEKCSYTDDNATTYGVFDAELTDMGVSEAKALNGLLTKLGWWKQLTGGKPTAGIVSPLSRCLQTSLQVLDGLMPASKVQVEENVRETLGEDTCDARRAKSSPPANQEGPCPFTDGLASAFPQFSFPVVDEQARELVRQGGLSKAKGKGRDKDKGLGFGLLSDEDSLWTTKRENQKHQVKRAVNFLFDVFQYIEERVVVVVTHSGTVRSVLLAMGREPYHPENTELVPVIVEPYYPTPVEEEELMDAK